MPKGVAVKALCLLVLACSLSAVETAPVPVLRVIDGDTIEVAVDLGGVPTPVRVRLPYIETPKGEDNDHGKSMPEADAATHALTELLPDWVILWGPGEKLDVDKFGRILAVVFTIVSVSGDTEIGRITKEYPGESVQEILIGKGHSVYWRKYGDAPEPHHSTFLKAQDGAKEWRLHSWGTAPQWMQDKANERTAPKKSDR